MVETLKPFMVFFNAKFTKASWDRFKGLSLQGVKLLSPTVADAIFTAGCAMLCWWNTAVECVGQCIVVQCSAVLCWAVLGQPNGTVWCSTVQCSALQVSYNTVQSWGVAWYRLWSAVHSIEYWVHCMFPCCDTITHQIKLWPQFVKKNSIIFSSKCHWGKCNRLTEL